MGDNDSWDGRLSLAIKVFAVSSVLWAAGVWLDTKLITVDEYEEQYNYTKYEVARLRLQNAEKEISDLEYKQSKVTDLNLRERRRYDELKERIPRLKKELHELGGTF